MRGHAAGTQGATTAAHYKSLTFICHISAIYKGHELQRKAHLKGMARSPSRKINNFTLFLPVRSPSLSLLLPAARRIGPGTSITPAELWKSNFPPKASSKCNGTYRARGGQYSPCMYIISPRWRVRRMGGACTCNKIRTCSAISESGTGRERQRER